MSGLHSRFDLPAGDSRLLINGQEITWYGCWLLAEGASLSAASPVTGFVDVPGVSGGQDLTLTTSGGRPAFGRRTLTLPLITTGDLDEMLEAKQRVGALNGTQVEVSWFGLPGTVTGRAMVGAWTDNWVNGIYKHSTVTVEVDADPVVTAPQVEWDLKAGNNEVRVEGNLETAPTFTLTPLSGQRTLSVTCNSRRIQIPTQSTTITGTVTIDCGSQATRMNGSLTAVTLASDYFELQPGTQTITVTGARGTLTYQPKFMI